MENTSDETPEEKRIRLKKLLREKTQRNKPSLSVTRNTLLSDPQTALLSMGVDDKCILDNAKTLVKSAKSLANSKQLSKLPKTDKTPISNTAKQLESMSSKKVIFDDSDEELPEIPWLSEK